jgi:ABC-type branched-subunit amino acid transport system substrate-binding protein
MLKLKKIIVASSIGLAFIVVACASRPAPLLPDSQASNDPRIETKFREARDYFEKGEDKRSFELFLALENAHPKDPLARVSTVFRARIALRRGEAETARKLLAPIINGKDSVAERARFYDGIALYQDGKMQKAIDRLIPFVGGLTDSDENLLLLSTLWRAADKIDDTCQAVSWLDRYLTSVTKKLIKNSEMAKLRQLISSISNVEDLQALAEILNPPETAWPIVMARLAELRFAAGDIDAARKVLDSVRQNSSGSTAAIESISEAVERRAVIDITSIGCILPLSGRSRLVGEATLKGVMLGARAVHITKDGQPLSVTIRDSGGKPERAAQAVEDLVTREQVAAIVGPLDGAVATAAAKQAAEMGVPLLTLSIKDNLPAVDQFVFREFATNKSEIRTLVKTAVATGAHGFATLYPDSGYGRTMVKLYRNELRAHGLQLVSAVKYSPDTKTFTDAVEQLNAREFDTLFVPDQSANIALIAPALAAAGLWSTSPGQSPNGSGRSIQLIVPSAGFSKGLIQRAGRYLDGALFTTFFFADAQSDSFDFIERFQTEYGDSQPNYLSAFGHDAVVLVAGAIKSGAVSREGIRHWLSNKSNSDAEKLGLPLATPFAGFDEKGEPQASPLVLRLVGNGFEIIR